MSRKLAFMITSALTAFVAITSLALLRPPGEPAGVTSAGATQAGPAGPLLGERSVWPAAAPEPAVAAQADPTANRPTAVIAQVSPTANRPAARAQISRDQAAQLAAASVGGGRVRSVELEREHGRAVYEVKVGRAEVHVDAASGEVFPEHDEDQDDED